MIATSLQATKTRKGALAIALLLLFVAAAWVAAPLWVGLTLGTAMAFAAQPVHRRLTDRLHGRRGWAAAITTLVGGIVMTTGGVAAVVVVVREMLVVLQLVKQKVSHGSPQVLLGEHGARVLASLGIDRVAAVERVQAEVARLSSYAAAMAGMVLQATTGVLLATVIGLWTMYYVLLDWPQVVTKLERILPFDPRDTRALTREFREVGRDAFIATIASALAQGVLAWVGFALAGVPQALTWSFLLALMSFVPVVGTACIWLPIGCYLISIGHPGRGFFIFVWGAIAVMATTDYFIRPHLVRTRSRAHPLLTLISLIGGLLAFGLPGLVIGPVVMALFVATLRIYERDATPPEP